MNNSKLSMICSQAVQIITEQWTKLGLTISETADIIHRIETKADELVAHIHDDKTRYNPMRVAFLGIVDWKVEMTKWYTPFANRRRQSILTKFSDNWFRIDRCGTAARAIDPASARLADANG